MTANFSGVDVVPLQGAVKVCYGWGEGDDQLWGVDVVPLIRQKMFFAIWGLCWCNLEKCERNNGQHSESIC